MDHLAYCDTKAKELINLLNGTKTMLIRGAAGRKIPHGRVKVGETVYLIENNGDGLIKAKSVVINAFHSEKLTAGESEQLIKDNADSLQLTPVQIKRWNGKRYLCLVELKDVIRIEHFSYDRASNMDDWIIVDDINSIKNSTQFSSAIP